MELSDVRLRQAELGFQCQAGEELNFSEMYPFRINTNDPSVVHNSLWKTLACKFMNTWMHNIFKVEVSASENGGKLAVYRKLKHFRALCEN